MRYLLGLFVALALGVMGCSETSGTGGTAGDGGSAGVGGAGGEDGEGGTGGTRGQVFPCTEQGIRDAIAEGGGPHTFACDGPTTVEVESTIGLGGEVILDGGGNLTVDGKLSHAVFEVGDGSVELRNFVITRATNGGGIMNRGTLLLTDSTVSGNQEDGIINLINDFPDPDSPIVGVLTLANTTVSGNGSAGILNWGTATISNSTVSNNLGQNTTDPPFNGGIVSYGTVTVVSSTFSGNGGGDVVGRADGVVTTSSSLGDGGCEVDANSVINSNGYNIESPGNTCGFDHADDQSGVTVEQLNLQPLADNGGRTQTHALGPGSVAIDLIDEEACVDAEGAPLTTDQRGVERPQADRCDVGAFELEWVVSDCTGFEEGRPCALGADEGECFEDACLPIKCEGLEDGTVCYRPAFMGGWAGVCAGGVCMQAWLERSEQQKNP